jgi:hypothetical protein
MTWEDCDRPTHDIYFETDEAFADSLSCNPDAFLVASIIPAMHYGEKRVFIDEEICPELKDGLYTAMGWLRHWFYSPDIERVKIEARARKALLYPEKQNRAGFFFSGGVDSFATLRANRLNFPLEHPWSIRDGLIVYGLELDDTKAFGHVLNRLLGVQQETGITLIPVYTNLYLNYRQEDAANNWSFWYREFMGAALAAVAHAFSKRLSVVSIATNYDIPNQRPHASHPLVDINYSSSDLRIRDDGLSLSRAAKTKLFANWDIAIQNLRVCNQYKQYKPEMLNCGKCEKCMRTILALLAYGVLDRSDAFPMKDISVQNVSAISLTKPTYPLYAELIGPLRNRGRDDLAKAIEHKLKGFHKLQKIENIKQKIKQIDSKYFNSSLIKFKRLIFQ